MRAEGNIVNKAMRGRGLLVCVVLIVIAAISLPALFAIMRRLGLPFGLRIVAMAEDYNWMLILAGETASKKAQSFWAMNDRNPLSPWWYIAFDRLYTGFPNGPYLTRLVMQPLLGLSAFAMVHAATAGRASALALGVGMLVSLGLYGGSIDQIHWNFLGALSLSMLSVACFGAWINGGRRNAVWYGASLVLWYCAFASYSFQVGAIVGIAILAAMRPPEASNRLKGLVAAGFEVLPYTVLLAAFVLAWKTTQNPALAAYYSLEPGLLLQNLPKSLQIGVSPQRYLPFVAVASAQLAWVLPMLCLLFGATAATAHFAARAESGLRVQDAIVVLLVSFGLVLPTALIESMSPTWTVGLRWPMLDQAWQPLFWLSLAALLAALLPVSIRVRRHMLSASVGVATVFAVAASLGYNHLQVSRSLTESALRGGLSDVVATLAPNQPVNLLLVVKPGVALSVPDVMSERIASVWFPGRDVGLRILTKDAQPLEPGHASWWKVRFGPDRADNVKIGGGSTTYGALRIFFFDGSRLSPIAELRAEDIAGYPAVWERSDPLTLSVQR